MKRSCHIWLSHMKSPIWIDHVAYEWIMSIVYVRSHMKRSCHIAYEDIMSHMNASCPIWIDHVTYEWIVPQIISGHICRDHVTCEKILSHTCHIWIDHVTYEEIMSRRIWIHHVTIRQIYNNKRKEKKSPHAFAMASTAYECMSNSYRRRDLLCSSADQVHDSLLCATWLFDMCDIAHWYGSHDSLICETLLIHIYMWDMTHSYVLFCSLMLWSSADQVYDFIETCDMTLCYVWHDSFICLTWLIDICDMTRWCMWNDSSTFMTWLIDICDMTRSYVWYDSFICVTQLINTCDMTLWYVWHDSLIYVTWLVDVCEMTHWHI